MLSLEEKERVAISSIDLNAYYWGKNISSAALHRIALTVNVNNSLYLECICNTLSEALVPDISILDTSRDSIYDRAQTNKVTNLEQTAMFISYHNYDALVILTFEKTKASFRQNIDTLTFHDTKAISSIDMMAYYPGKYFYCSTAPNSTDG